MLSSWIFDKNQTRRKITRKKEEISVSKHIWRTTPESRVSNFENFSPLKYAKNIHASKLHETHYSWNFLSPSVDGGKNTFTIQTRFFTIPRLRSSYHLVRWPMNNISTTFCNALSDDESTYANLYQSEDNDLKRAIPKRNERRRWLKLIFNSHACTLETSANALTSVIYIIT